MSQEFTPGRGLDIGTSFIIATRQYKGEDKKDKVLYTEFRDAFFRMKPSSPIARNMMEKGLKGQQYFTDVDNSFVVVGKDAIERAVERNACASRPLVRGVISPKQKQARRILRYIFKEILGEPLQEGERLVYSVPAQPIDQGADDFDVGFHTDALNNDLNALGYKASSVPEGEAICYSELEEDNYSGVALSFGAGMVNACLMSAGEGILHWSTTRSGDWIDRMAAQATAAPDTVIQIEKEHTQFEIGKEIPGNPLLTAVSLYYIRLIDYTVQHLVTQLSRADNLPKFTEAIPIIIAGGTSRAQGFVGQFERSLAQYNQGELELPFKIKGVRHAKNPLRAVSRGCLLASQLSE
jgi:hypothetical protein